MADSLLYYWPYFVALFWGGITLKVTYDGLKTGKPGTYFLGLAPFYFILGVLVASVYFEGYLSTGIALYYWRWGAVAVAAYGVACLIARRVMRNREQGAASGTEDRYLTPDELGDPVAAEVSWTPCRGGGTSFRTRRLVMERPDRLVFRGTAQAYVFNALFAGGGIAFPFLIGAEGDTGMYIFLTLFGFIFAAAGLYGLYISARPTVLDRQRGLLWSGWGATESGAGRTVRLRDIHALQLVAERISSSDSRRNYTSYELNAVLSDGTRHNVIDHGDQAAIRADADTVADFLNCPVWDATASNASGVRIVPPRKHATVW